MFARTQRLTLRPGWIEDAPELARAIGHAVVCRNLAAAPWPYTRADAERFLTLPCSIAAVRLLIFSHEHGGVQLVGGVEYEHRGFNHQFGYWITPYAWGRGYATEAAHAVIGMARALRIPQLTARSMLDNPASARVLRKLGFRPTGRITPTFSRARGIEVPCMEHALDLGEGSVHPDPARMAA